MKKYKSIWFDLDNTLLDFDYASKYAFEKVLETVGIQNSLETLAIYKKINTRVWGEFERNEISTQVLKKKRWTLFLQELNNSHDPLLASQEYRTALTEPIKAMNGAIELLDKLQGKVELLIVTNGFTEVQKPRLTHFNIGDYFDEIIISEEIGFAKPQEAFFLYAYNKSGINNKEDILMVGDSYSSDIQGAISFGIDSCWFKPSADEKVGATYLISHLDELLLGLNI